MSPIKSMIAVLFALGSAGALAQNAAPPQPPASKPVDDSASYGPVLNPQTPPATTAQPTTSSTQAIGEARPQAQEERSGQPPASKHTEVDPSARPAPEAVRPEPPQQQSQEAQRTQQGATPQERQQPQKRPPQASRRSVEQRIAPTPRIAAPASKPAPSVPAPVTPAPAAPHTSQVVGCAGGVCTDASGMSYNASGPGNAGVSRDGRLCTSNGVTVQCL